MSTREPVDPRPLARHFDLTPESAWEDVQAQYRRLVQQWHPDRHPQGTREEAQAEFIEIVASFKRLRHHYGEHGQLPPPPPPELPVRSRHPRSTDRVIPRAASGPPEQPVALWLRVLRSPITIVTAVLVLATGLGTLVLVLDRQLEDEIRERAREQVREQVLEGKSGEVPIGKR